MPRHRSERGGADVVTPFSESRESKKVVSVTELLDQFKAETEPDAPQQPKWETVNGTGDSVLDKFSNVATWSDILMPLGRTEAKVQDSDTLEAWKRPGGTDPISAKVPKSRPAQSLSLVNRRRATMRARPETQQVKVYAHLHYGSDLSAASKASVDSDAVGLPTLVIEACKSCGICSKALTTGNMANPYRAAGRRHATRGPLSRTTRARARRDLRRGRRQGSAADHPHWQT